MPELENPQPPADADWQAWDIYLRRATLAQDLELRTRQIEASAAHAAAQQATADAMREHAALQANMIAALNAPQGDGMTPAFVLELLRIVTKESA